VFFRYCSAQAGQYFLAARSLKLSLSSGLVAVIGVTPSCESLIPPASRCYPTVILHLFLLRSWLRSDEHCLPVNTLAVDSPREKVLSALKAETGFGG
jgi:hypothetical protein